MTKRETFEIQGRERARQMSCLGIKFTMEKASNRPKKEKFFRLYLSAFVSWFAGVQLFERRKMPSGGKVSR